MPNKESDRFIEKHLWGSIQALSGLYCAVFATWTYYHPRSISVPAGDNLRPPATEIGLVVKTMPLYLFIGIVVLGLSVAIPAIIGMIRRWKKPSPLLSEEEGPQATSKLRSSSPPLLSMPRVRIIKESIDRRGNITLTFKNLGNAKAAGVTVRHWTEAGFHIQGSAFVSLGPPGWMPKFSTKDVPPKSTASRSLEPGQEFAETWTEDTEEKCKIREEYPSHIIQSRGEVTYTNSTGSSGFRSNFCYVPKVASEGWTIPKCDCIVGNEEEEQQ